MSFIDRIASGVESPIEEILLEAFKVVCGSKLVLVSQDDAPDIARWAYADEGQKHIFVAPQAKIGRYRADFMTAAYKPWVHPVVICVECDGHHYHRANVKQLYRDMDRDAWFRSKHIDTMRFAGWRIHKDPYRCVQQVVQQLTGATPYGCRSIGETLTEFNKDGDELNERSHGFSDRANFSFAGAE